MSKKSMTLSQDDQQHDELSEDIEVVGPGQILSEARKKISLSTEDVAKKLNFKTSLVENIEQDKFDQKLPATYNRGYLCSYAKLVNADVNDVLSAYDMLGVAEVQRSEMQSFSNLTEKQAEHSRLMWFSYFIVAILLGLMVLWWQQEPKQSVDETTVDELIVSSLPTLSLDAESKLETSSTNNNVQTTEIMGEGTEVDLTESESDELVSAREQINLSNDSQDSSTEVDSIVDVIEEETMDRPLSEDDTLVADLSTAVFTFSGDCWVNIYDATGERVAWGVKKSGYVMTVSGVAPLKVTLGKPELATIVFNEQLIDMSSFNVGNIAKFTLPLSL